MVMSEIVRTFDNIIRLDIFVCKCRLFNYICNTILKNNNIMPVKHFGVSLDEYLLKALYDFMIENKFSNNSHVFLSLKETINHCNLIMTLPG